MKLSKTILKEEFKELWKNLPEGSLLTQLVASANAYGYAVSFTFDKFSNLTVDIKEKE